MNNLHMSLVRKCFRARISIVICMRKVSDNELLLIKHRQTNLVKILLESMVKICKKGRYHITNLVD